MNRLCVGDAKKNDVIKEIKADEVYGQMSFQPKINKVSKALVEDYRRDLIENGVSNL